MNKKVLMTPTPSMVTGLSLVTLMKIGDFTATWSALNITKKFEENPGEETQYIKCDQCDKNYSFNNYLRKRGITKQNKPHTNIPFYCDVYQEHLDTNNCPTNHDKCT